MFEADHYRLKAAECARRAEEASTEATSTALRVAAHSWLLLAKVLDGPQNPERVTTEKRWPSTRGIMKRVHFRAPAGVYLRLRLAHRQPQGALAFRRFATLAKAVRFVIEQLPVEAHSGYIELGNGYLYTDQIRQLYKSEAYPFKRRLERRAH
jgi:hypothetical protein